MLETIGIVAAVLVIIVLVVLGYAATKPNVVSYRRSAHIKAPPEKIRPLIDNFQNWKLWSPWERKDPNLHRMYDGPESGVGAIYSWSGNRNVGSGRMEILDASDARVRIKLDFITPFTASNIAEFTFTPQSAGTQVDWVMTGPNLFIGKVMGLFLDMDKMIGNDFEKGLADMKTAAES